MSEEDEIEKSNIYDADTHGDRCRWVKGERSVNGVCSDLRLLEAYEGEG